MDVQKLKETTLTQSPAENMFWTRSGTAVNNLKELADHIEQMSQEEFQHHVVADAQHSDFAAWTHDVFQNPFLAQDLKLEANLTDQSHCAKTIRDHIAWLERS